MLILSTYICLPYMFYYLLLKKPLISNMGQIKTFWTYVLTKVWEIFFEILWPSEFYFLPWQTLLIKRSHSEIRHTILSNICIRNANDPITFTFSENSNYWHESLLEVIRQNIADGCQQTFCFQSLLTLPSNVLPLHLKQTFLSVIWIFTEGEVIKSKLSCPAYSMNIHLRWRWWDQIQSTF